MSALSSDNEDGRGTSQQGPGDAEEVGKRENGNVVTNQPGDCQLRDWQDGLCSCQNDFGNCLLVALCPLCSTAYEFHKHKENPLLGFCFPGMLTALIAQYRARHGITGTLCTDCLTTTFCGYCMLCRLHRDFKHYSHDEQTNQP